MLTQECKLHIFKIRLDNYNKFIILILFYYPFFFAFRVRLVRRGKTAFRYYKIIYILLLN